MDAVAIEEKLSRRAFLRLAMAFGVQTLALTTPFGRALAANVVSDGPYGPLLPADADGLQLPAGFSARIIAVTGSEVGSTGYEWHSAPDGGATFKSGKDFIYVSNSESTFDGGVSALRMSKRGEILDAYPILSDTSRNCAGGVTGWNTWLSCEERSRGVVWECDPEGRNEAVAHPGMGAFTHEAACWDRKSRAVYLTEDRDDGCFYRFRPNRSGRLDSGVLEVAVVDGEGRVTWREVPNPDPGVLQTSTRRQVEEATHFDGGEGIVCAFKRIFFTTKGDNRVWSYDPKKQRMSVVYDRDSAPDLPLSGVDNITDGYRGDLIVAEDGGNMELVLITREGEVAPILRLPFQRGSELTGPAFDPKGRRLFVSSQRGGAGGQGITYEITGPFKQRQRR